MDRRTFVAAAVAAALMGAARAANDIPDETAIRDILRRRIDDEKLSLGMCVGVWKRGRRTIVAYGRRRSADAAPVTSQTLFEIGSVTKVFTSLLLADMVRRRDVALDDPVSRYLPPDFKVPQYDGRAMTLADLATHTSGLPLFPPLQGPPLAALARYTPEALRDWLATFVLARAPGSQWEYSNAGYALLGLALAHCGGASWETLLQRRVADPLGLRDTQLYAAHAAGERRAEGHTPDLKPGPPLDLGVFAPAGGLLSSVDELLTFVAAVMPGSRTAAFAQTLLQTRRPAPPIGGEQALGWEITGGVRGFVGKDGVTAGQTTSVVFDADARIGVVVTSNALPLLRRPPPDGGIGAADLARHLLRPELALGTR